MFCPHCHNKIPDGRNICPLCYANLVRREQPSAEREAEGSEERQPRPEAEARAEQEQPSPPIRKGSRQSKPQSGSRRR